ncbi:MAG: signal peptidase II [Syntrophomonas sp.]|nr:signal peptidase II [Syntrophomonas sp.]
MRFWLSIILILLFDQLSKFWIASTMLIGGSKTVIEGVLSLSYVHNRGAAFGILQGGWWLFLVIAFCVIAAMVFLNVKFSLRPSLQYMTGLVVGGSLGNVIDRWLYGAVRDFISIGWWPVFNVADMAIVSGGALLMLYILLNDNLEHEL